MPGRIAGGLLYLAKNVFNHHEFELILTKQEIGELTAMTKESAQRILKDFQDEGIIQIKNNYLEITDLDRLSQEPSPHKSVFLTSVSTGLPKTVSYILRLNPCVQ